jgi:hypothetical protein
VLQRDSNTQLAAGTTSAPPFDDTRISNESQPGSATLLAMEAEFGPNLGNSLVVQWREYALRGLWVFPLAAGSKHPGELGIKWGETWVKKGRNPYPQLAVAHSDQADGLWLATGQVSKRVVLDIDKREAAEYWRKKLGDEVFDRTLRVSRGHPDKVHLHFRIPVGDDRPWPGYSDNRLGYDFRGDGGGVVLPPSVHRSGSRYEWVGGELVDVPECLRRPERVRPTAAAGEVRTCSEADESPQARAVLSKQLARVRTMQSGETDNTMNTVAFLLGKFIGGGLLNEEHVRRELVAAVPAAEMDLDHAVDKIEHGIEDGKQQPMPAPVAGTGRRELCEVRMEDSATDVVALSEAIDVGAIPDLFVSSGGLMQVYTVRDDPALPVGEIRKGSGRVDAAALGNLLARHIRYYTEEQENGELVQKRRQPSTAVINHVLGGRDWPRLPPLRRITRVPLLRADGTILREKGYDSASGVWFDPREDFSELPSDPTPGYVADARSFLLDQVMYDFPWKDKADLANAVAMLCTPALRDFIVGPSGGNVPTPLFVIKAHAAGTGKTLLAELVGRTFGQAMTAWVDDNDELHKVIGALLADHSNAVCILDNVGSGHQIRQPVLANLITSGIWTGRILGQSRTMSVVNDRLWIATGNNVRYGGDMASRTVEIDVDSQEERPDLRDGFRIPDLGSWIQSSANRAKVVSALLILARDWVAAGAPQIVTRRRGFTQWASAMAGFLDFHGVPGFLQNDDTVQEADTEREQWCAFLTTWYEKFGGEHKAVRELLRSHIGALNDGWGDAFLLVDAKSGHELSPIAAGNRLREKVGVPIDGLVLRSGKPGSENSKKSNVYWVEPHRPPAR